MSKRPGPWICPECAGSWLKNFTFRHRVNDCSLGYREDSRQYADFERLQSDRIFKRAATPAEETLFQVIYDDPLIPGSGTVEVTRPSAYRTRIINGLNPDSTQGEE